MADFYDPTSDIQTEWDTTGGNHYGEIDDGIRNPNQPTLADYVRSKGNGDVDEWGFPTVAGSPVEICGWVYVETGSNATIEVSLQQDGVERASLAVPVNTPQGWKHCAWMSPSGDLSTLTIEVTMVKSGGGAGTYAYVYAAYLRAGPNLDKQVAASGDDGRRYGVNNFTTTEGAPGDKIGYYSFTASHHFSRWEGVTYEGTPDVSYMELYAHEAGTGSPQWKVYGVEEADPAAPTTYAEFDADPLTDAAVDWDDAFTINTWEQSPSLNSIFAELGDRDNKAAMVQVKDDAGTGTNYNRIRTYDYSENSYLRCNPQRHYDHYSYPRRSYPSNRNSQSHPRRYPAKHLYKTPYS